MSSSSVDKKKNKRKRAQDKPEPVFVTFDDCWNWWQFKATRDDLVNASQAFQIPARPSYTRYKVWPLWETARDRIRTRETEFMTTVKRLRLETVEAKQESNKQRSDNLRLKHDIRKWYETMTREVHAWVRSTYVGRVIPMTVVPHIAFQWTSCGYGSGPHPDVSVPDQHASEKLRVLHADFVLTGVSGYTPITDEWKAYRWDGVRLFGLMNFGDSKWHGTMADTEVKFEADKLVPDTTTAVVPGKMRWFKPRDAVPRVYKYRSGDHVTLQYSCNSYWTGRPDPDTGVTIGTRSPLNFLELYREYTDGVQAMVRSGLMGIYPDQELFGVTPLMAIIAAYLAKGFVDRCPR